MASTISLSDHENQINCYHSIKLDDNERNRKRRRPQHELGEDSKLVSYSRNDDLTQQDTKVKHRRGRYRHSCSSTLFLCIALLYACCRNDCIPSALAIRLRERTQHQTDTTAFQQKRVLQNGGNPTPSINYLVPTSLWTSRGARDQFDVGNAVRVSPFDKNILYATNRKGDLRVLDANNGKSMATVSPAPRTLTDEGVTSIWSLYSNSGMTFGSFPGTKTTEKSTPDDNGSDNDDGYNDYLQFLINNGINQDKDSQSTPSTKTAPSRFVVYSIVDESPDVSRFLPKMRVVCVSIPEHKVMWTSAGLPGTPNGSPLVYYSDEATMSSSSSNSDSDGDDRMFIVLTHNSVLQRPDNTTQTTGHLTVLDPSTGYVKWTESEWSRDEVPKGYGPPQVSHRPIHGGGNSGGSPANKNDIIVWTSSDQEGRGRSGNLFSFQMKSSSELEADAKNNNTFGTGGQTDPFEIRVLKKVRWNSIAKPALSRNGTNLFVGVTGNAVRGWNELAQFTQTASWSTQLVPLKDGSSNITSSTLKYPDDVVVSTAPVLSADEERLFVVTVRNETVCLDARTGVRQWAAKTRHPSPFLSEPKASPDNQRLYVIRSEDGIVHAINQKDGKILWSFGCDESGLPSGSRCSTPPVTADFDLSADGTTLFYGISDGRIVAVTLGEAEKVEAPPSPSPPSSPSSPSISTTISIANDDRGPLEFDRKNDVGSLMAASNSKNQRVGLKIAGTVVAIIVCLALGMISVMYVVRSKGIDLKDLANYRLPRYGSKKDGGGKRHSYVARLDGPDQYEDQIIARLSEDEQSIEDQFNTLWVDPTHSDPKYYVHDDEESPTADRLSILLGTSNRIAPISDNFGFGQAVLI